MLLLGISNVPFTPRTVHPAAKPTQLVERFLMIFPKLIEVLCSAIQHLFEIGVPLSLFGVLQLIFARSLFHHDHRGPRRSPSCDRDGCEDSRRTIRVEGGQDLRAWLR